MLFLQFLGFYIFLQSFIILEFLDCIVDFDVFMQVYKQNHIILRSNIVI
jgi:hypothetical protein